MAPEKVPGLIPVTTGLLLQQLASRVPRGQIVVEIGAFKGRSSCFLANRLQDGVYVYSVDPHGLAGSERGRGGRFAGDDVRDEYLKNIEGYDVVPIRALSKDAPIPSDPIGLLWIDGDHSWEAVSEDVRRWSPHVALGGFIVLDDYGTFHPGVNRIVKQLTSDTRWTGWSFNPKPLAYARRRA